MSIQIPKYDIPQYRNMRTELGPQPESKVATGLSTASLPASMGLNDSGHQSIANTSPIVQQLSSSSSRANNSPQVQHIAQMQVMANASPGVQHITQRMARANAPAPSQPVVQRVKIKNLDTEKDSDRDAILDQIKGMSYQSLYQLGEALAAESDGNNSKWYLQYLQGVFTEELVKDVDKDSGIYVAVLVSINGAPVYRTQAHKGGDDHRFQTFKFPFKSSNPPKEHIISSKDAEVGAFGEAWNFIDRKFPSGRHYSGHLSSIRFTVVGNFGPCDGCKDRLDALVDDTNQRTNDVLGQHDNLASAETIYQNPPLHKERGNFDHLPTTYGSDTDKQTDLLGYKGTIAIMPPTMDISKPLDQTFTFQSTPQSLFSSNPPLSTPKFGQPSKSSKFDRGREDMEED